VYYDCLFTLLNKYHGEKRRKLDKPIATHSVRYGYYQPKPKMVKHNFRTIIFMWSMRRLNMHLGRPNLFSFGFGGSGVFAFPISSHYIPLKFAMCSCRCSLIAPHFIPYVLPKVELLYKVINYKAGLKGNTSILLCPMFPKKCDG
jgi:hypothetical protein